MDSSLNQTLEPENVEDEKRVIKNRPVGRRLAEVTKELAGCKLDGSAIVFEDSEEEEVVVEGHILEQAENLKVSANNDPPPAATMVNYDRKDEADDANAIQNARDCKMPFNKHDIMLWFSLIESKMQFAGLKRQWSKRQVLVQLIPPEFHSDFKHLLQLQEDQAGALPYFNLKSAIIKQFGPKQADGFDKAISRVMTSSPSHLGRQIIHDICPNAQPLSGCHCAAVVLGIWRRSLPTAVRNQIADMTFDATTWSAVFDKADSVWSSNSANTTVVSALTKDSAASADAEVAAATGSSKPRGNRGGRNNRNNRGQGQGGGAGNNSGNGNNKANRGPRHSDNPPNSACNVHWKFGKGAWHCADRHGCPWRDYESPKPHHNPNIVAEIDAEVV